MTNIFYQTIITCLNIQINIRMLKTAKEHLKNSKMNYQKHFTHSLYNAYLLTIIVFSSIIHAFFPMVLRQHASRGIVRIYNSMKKHAHLRRMINDENKNVKN